MYRFASSGEIGEPCGMPRRLSRQVTSADARSPLLDESTLQQVEPHPGKFRLEDFERLSKRSPDAYVPVLGALTVRT